MLVTLMQHIYYKRAVPGENFTMHMKLLSPDLCMYFKNLLYLTNGDGDAHQHTSKVIDRHLHYKHLNILTTHLFFYHLPYEW